MRAYFKPSDSRWAPDKIHRCVISRYPFIPAFNHTRRVIERAAVPAFRRKQQAKASHRFWAICSANVSEVFSADIHRQCERPGFLRRLFETPEERAAREEKAFAEWRERYLANQRNVKPHLHPKNMIRREQLYTGRIGYIHSFNLIADEPLHPGDPVVLTPAGTARRAQTVNRDSQSDQEV